MTRLDDSFRCLVGDIYGYIIRDIYRYIVGDIYRCIVKDIYRYILGYIYRYMVGYLQIQGSAESRVAISACFIISYISVENVVYNDY